MNKPKHTKGPWFYSYDGLDGHFRFYREPQGHKAYGLEEGPFKSFSEAKKHLLEKARHDVMEARMTVASIRDYKATGEAND